MEINISNLDISKLKELNKKLTEHKKMLLSDFETSDGTILKNRDALKARIKEMINDKLYNENFKNILKDKKSKEKTTEILKYMRTSHGNVEN